MKLKKFKPTDYVKVIKNGKVIKEGLGLSVFYNNLTTNIMVAPSTAFDGAFAFDDVVTSDYQSVCVQGVTTYMIADYDKAAKMFDFTYQSNNQMEQKIAEQMALLEKRINNIIKAIVIREVSKKDVRTIIRLADEMARTIEEDLTKDESIEKLGVNIAAINILGINPKTETRKALEAAAREQILKEQDDAIYKRRNAAIEQERTIKENEINTEIKVAEKEKEKEEKEQEMKLYVQRCDLDMMKEREEREQEMRMRALRSELEMSTEKQEKEFALKEMAAAKKLQIESKEMLGRIELENNEMLGKIELEKKNGEYTALQTENERIKADQQAYALKALVDAYNNLNVALVEACAMAQTDPSTLMAKAFMNIGENADKIGVLNLTPDLLQTITNGFAQKE
ncbi:SPFH domain-containing protein [Butyrivibrio sp. LB2008]|uniref:SPFH domain-containing protein n=1 Tax=Butyrivibrio sp. LB2008 TaxID=1408305 RepID=UPI00047C0570|nr:SPFH domain-containing protein [Butyrivibrio sp. LB2008]